MKARASLLKHFKIRTIMLIVGLLVLLSAGYINLKIARSNEVTTESMLLGSTTGQPVFYLNSLIFPEQIEIPFGSTHTNRYLEGVSLFPPSPEIIKASSKDINGSDSITIQYVGNDTRSIFKCDGTPLNPSEPSQSLYFINPTGDLACAEIVNHQPDFKRSQVVVKNIDVMRILYGIDQNRDQTSDQYVLANNPNFSLGNIITIKVNLLLKTFEKESPSPKFYILADEQVGPYSDGYVRKTLTIVLPTKPLTSLEPTVRTPS